MSKPKKATAGERIEAKRIGCKVSELGPGNLTDARRIDSALRRAVREAWSANWAGTNVFNKKEELERKYKVKL